MRDACPEDAPSKQWMMIHGPYFDKCGARSLTCGGVPPKKKNKLSRPPAQDVQAGGDASSWKVSAGGAEEVPEHPPPCWPPIRSSNLAGYLAIL
mmetsp:Transcript_101942/g.328854  ORF Transcript_101942/g.328854 Transcript_101942/m.328854 type:complete len:94 (+) Transcript_101942:316-597(+)